MHTFSHLFSLSCTAAVACQRKTAPVVAPCLPRVRLLLPDQAAVDKDVQINMDQLKGDDYVPVVTIGVWACLDWLLTGYGYGTRCVATY